MSFCTQLVHKGLISPDQFVSAMEEYQKARKPLGRMAMEIGLISMKQIFEILARQTETKQKFGEIAIDLGYMTRSQLDMLLTKQSTQNLSIGEILLARGDISREQMDAEYKSYSEEQSDTWGGQEPCICGNGCKYRLDLEKSVNPGSPAISV